MSDNNWQQETEERKARLIEFIGTLSLDYHANFVPMSMSRNAVEKPRKPNDLTINWRITLTGDKRRGKLETDYSQGIGYLPKAAGYDLKCVDDFELAHKACETGDVYKHTRSLKIGSVTPPELVDVLYGLITEAEAIEYATFEEWAQEFGYDTDSRKAEALYCACVSTGLQLRRITGDDNLRKLHELYQDY